MGSSVRTGETNDKGRRVNEEVKLGRGECAPKNRAFELVPSTIVQGLRMTRVCGV